MSETLEVNLSSCKEIIVLSPTGNREDDIHLVCFSPTKVIFQLMEKLPKEKWGDNQKMLEHIHMGPSSEVIIPLKEEQE